MGRKGEDVLEQLFFGGSCKHSVMKNARKSVVVLVS